MTVPAPITLTWSSPSTDAVPNFNIDLPNGNSSSSDAMIGDVMRLQCRRAGASAWTDYVVHTILAADIVADTISDSNGLVFENGNYEFRGRLERGAEVTDWSATVPVLVARVPDNTVAPVITGNVQVGQTLTTTNGTWSHDPFSFSYQWRREGSDIALATSSTYLLVSGDAGRHITCAVSATNTAGTSQPTVSNSLLIDGGTPPALDGSAFGSWSSGTTYTVTLTTVQANDIVILAIATNTRQVSSISDVAGLTWAQRAQAGSNPIELWWAKSTGALSGDVITITLTGVPTFSVCSAFGISGANFASPFDPDPGLPAEAGSGTLTIDTTNPNDIIIGAFRLAGASGTVGAGYTAIQNGSFLLTEYKIVTSVQNNVAVDFSAATSNGSIADAVSA